MKINRSNFSTQILILAMAAVVLLVMVQAANAQTADSPLIAQAASRNQSVDTAPGKARVLKIKMPRKSLGERLLDNTSLGYYQQFLGPTFDGETASTYNVFQEGLDTPGSGKAPLQSFHALNLRHQISTDWAVGATFSAVNGYTDEVVNRDRNNFNFVNSGQVDFFNARAYISLPAWKNALGTLFTTLSYEHPTSELSKADNMKWGWVAAQSFAFDLPSLKWNAGLQGQVYRLYYETNVKPPPFLGGSPTPLQTMIISGGPYVNYRFNDNWMLGSILTFDWDQRGLQSGSRDFNNNLSDRGRMTLSYFPTALPYLQSVGLFTQALLKFRPETTAVGADLAVRF
jgi:hypothetical protein